MLCSYPQSIFMCLQLHVCVTTILDLYIVYNFLAQPNKVIFTWQNVIHKNKIVIILIRALRDRWEKAN